MRPAFCLKLQLDYSYRKNIKHSELSADSTFGHKVVEKPNILSFIEIDVPQLINLWCISSYFYLLNMTVVNILIQENTIK